MTTRMSAAQYQAAELASLDERRFQDRVCDAAFVTGWWVTHTPRVKTSRGVHMTTVSYQGQGFPDLTLIHAVFEPIFAELKTNRGSLTREQRAWRARIEAAPGVRYRLWRPKHWAEILAELEGEGS